MQNEFRSVKTKSNIDMQYYIWFTIQVLYTLYMNIDLPSPLAHFILLNL